MNVIINGVNSDTINGLQILSLPPITKPRMRTSIATIDGRPGDIVTPLGYEAYNKTIKILLHDTYDLPAIMAYFNQAGTIIFSNDPGMVYTFETIEAINYERAVKFKTASVTIHVQPYKTSASEQPSESESSSFMDSEPYLFRQTPDGADMEIDELVGGSVVFNQLCNAASVTVANGHKYFMKKGTAYSLGASTGTAITGLTSGSDMVIDLTAWFGSTIADYIYSVEQATAGAGVELAKKWAGIKGYIPYDAGSLKSVSNVSAHKMVGKNLAQVTIGNITWNTMQIKVNDDRSISITGSPQTNGAREIGVAHLCEGTYVTEQADSTDYYLQVQAPDGQFRSNMSSAISLTLDTPADCKIRIFVRGGKTYNNATIYPMIRCADVQDATFEPYTAHTYPLDSSLALRGLPKLDGDTFYYDGDIYKADGTVERKYKYLEITSCNYTGATGTGRKYAEIPIAGSDAFLSATQAISNGYQITAAVPTDDGKYARFYGAHLYLYDGRFTDKATADSILASEKPQILYALATPTTEQAEPYTALQTVYDGGTEEYVTDSIPAGHNTKYIVPIEMTVTNSGNADSAPSITITGSGAIEVTVDGLIAFEISMPSTGTIVIDSGAMDAMDGDGNLANRSVSGDYSNLRLAPGEHTIIISGDATSVSLQNVSRWI